MLNAFTGIIALIPGSNPAQVAANTEFKIQKDGVDVTVKELTSSGLMDRTTLETDNLGMFPDHFIEDVTVLSYVSLDGSFVFSRPTTTPVPGASVVSAQLNDSLLSFVLSDGTSTNGVNISGLINQGTGGTGDVSSEQVVQIIRDTLAAGTRITLPYIAGSNQVQVNTSATVNQTDSFLLARANHTGSQAIDTIEGLTGALSSKATSGINGLPPGVTLTVTYNGTAWPSRPTARTDIPVIWNGGTTEPAGGLIGDVWNRDGA